MEGRVFVVGFSAGVQHARALEKMVGNQMVERTEIRFFPE
jgi:hypothetical protein